jgi:phosphomannomutase
MTSINEAIFKAYDIRGIYPTDINEEVVKKIASVCLDFFDGDEKSGDGMVVIAHDGRHGSTELARAAKAGLLAAAHEKNGRLLEIKEIGLATTPMFYFLVHHLSAEGGIMVTASHNPKEYNGLKIVRRGAEMISGTDLLAALRKSENTKKTGKNKKS